VIVDVDVDVIVVIDGDEKSTADPTQDIGFNRPASGT
jgi:hypothetical protein